MKGLIMLSLYLLACLNALHSFSEAVHSSKHHGGSEVPRPRLLPVLLVLTKISLHLIISLPEVIQNIQGSLNLGQALLYLPLQDIFWVQICSGLTN